jgi:ketosteroid isomerase-like protein
MNRFLGSLIGSVLLCIGTPALAEENAADTVSALDIAFQAAVERNDATVMAKILADDFVLVTGKGKTYTKTDLLAAAKDGKTVYEHQVASTRTVRVWGDTAVVTALLWLKGTNEGTPFDYQLWYSDTYVHTSSGWRYVFGQASIPLPAAP